MSMQEIQEDLETFSKQGHINNREQVITDMKVREDLNSLNLNEWWEAFEVNQSQMEELERLDNQLRDMKNELHQYAATEVQQGRNVLLEEIEESLKRIHQLKTPK